MATRVFITGMATVGCVCLVFGGAHWQSSDPVKFACYLIAALLASSLKVSLPGIEGTLSVNFLFTLLGILELSLPETLLIGIASTLAQFYWRPARKVKLVQLIFNLSQVTVSSCGGLRSLQAGRGLRSSCAGPAGASGRSDYAFRLQHRSDVHDHRADGRASPSPRSGKTAISGHFRTTWSGQPQRVWSTF